MVRRVAEKLDMDPGTVAGRVIAAQPTSGGARDLPARAGDPPPVAREPTKLTSRERRERALLAMCIAQPEQGRDYLARLTPEHLSPLGMRAVGWLMANLDDPASNLPREDAELSSLVSELIVSAHDQEPDDWGMEHNFLLLEQRRLEAEIAAAGKKNDYERRAALSRERAALVQRIAHAERVGG
jgi:hypothetical protein